MNIYIINEINLWSFIQGADLMLGYSLLRAVDFNKEADPENIIDVALNFIHRSFFRSLSHSSGFGKNVITFGADMPSSVHADEKNK